MPQPISSQARGRKRPVETSNSHSRYVDLFLINFSPSIVEKTAGIPIDPTRTAGPGDPNCVGILRNLPPTLASFKHPSINCKTNSCLFSSPPGIASLSTLRSCAMDRFHTAFQYLILNRHTCPATRTTQNALHLEFFLIRIYRAIF